MKCLLQARDLTVRYRARGRGRRGAGSVEALHGVSLELGVGESLAVVGESGSGKSTLARALLGLVAPSGGEVLWNGTGLSRLSPTEMRGFRSSVQMVFQDPRGSLNPRLTAGGVLREALSLRGGGSGGRGPGSDPDGDSTARTPEALLERVGLPTDIVRARPSELSGGQCQRLGIARALAVSPGILVLDEPTSALDVSEQARVVNLLAELRRELGLGCLLISHDLPLVRLFSDRVMILRQGRMVESGTTRDVMGAPEDPYARQLVQAGLRGSEGMG